jgi:hypothetical protein
VKSATLVKISILEYFKSKRKSPQQEDEEINDDGMRQVEKKKKKINVEECIYPSTSADNSVTKYDDNGERDIPECWSLEMFLQKKVEYPWMLVKNRKQEVLERTNLPTFLILFKNVICIKTSVCPNITLVGNSVPIMKHSHIQNNVSNKIIVGSS